MREGSIGRAGRVQRSSSEEQWSHVERGQNRESLSQPCTLRALHRHTAGLQPHRSQVRHHSLVR